MGPNLTRLFAEQKQDTMESDLAYDTLRDLFYCHGEALIEALEEALKSFEITQDVAIYPTDHWAPRAKALLAQLESEAQR